MIPEKYELIETISENGKREYKVKEESGQSRLLRVFSSREEDRVAFLSSHFSKWSDFDHPHLAPPIDFGRFSSQDKPFHYTAMESWEGRDLLEGASDFSDEDRWKVTSQLFSALEYLHQRGYVHGNLSPFALEVLSEEGGIRVRLRHLWGMASEGTPLREGDEVHSDYWAPEVLCHLPVDRRSDIYSLGATLYSLWTLTKPYTAGARDRLLEEASWPEDVDLPEVLRLAITKALREDPLERHASLKDFRDDLLSLPEAASHLKDLELTSTRDFSSNYDPDRGREILAQWTHLFDHNAPQESYPYLWIQGDRGSGKSHLLSRLGAYARLEGAEVYRGGGTPGTIRPLSSLRLKPEETSQFMSTRETSFWECDWSRAEIWEKIHKRLCSQGEGLFVLLIDNLEECDELTLKFLEYILSLEKPQGSIMVAATWSEIPPRTLFSDWWDRMKQRGKTRSYTLSPREEGSSSEGEEEISPEALKLLGLLHLYGEAVSGEFLCRWLHWKADDFYRELARLFERGLAQVHRGGIETTISGREFLAQREGEVPTEELKKCLLQDRDHLSPFQLIEIEEEGLARAGWTALSWGCYGLAKDYYSRLIKKDDQDDPQYLDHLEKYLDVLDKNNDYFAIFFDLLPKIDFEILREDQKPWFYFVLAKTFFKIRRLELAEEYLQNGLESLSGPQMERKPLFQVYLSMVKYEKGDVSQAMIILENAEKESQEPERKLYSAYQFSEMKINHGEYKAALEKIDSLMPQVEDTPHSQGLLAIQRARVALEKSDFKEVKEPVERAIQTFRQLGDAYHLASALLLQASLYKTQYLYDQALKPAREAFYLALTLDAPKLIWNSRKVLGEIQLEMGQRKEGTTHLLKSIYQANMAREPGILCELLMIMGKVHLERKDAGRAEVLMRKARELSQEKNLPYLNARVDFLSSQVARLIGDSDIEKALRDRALATFHRLGNKKEVCEVLLDKLSRQKEQGMPLDSNLLGRLKGALDKLGIAYLQQQYQKLNAG